MPALLSVMSTLKKDRGALWFLCSYALFMDAILTIQYNIAIYLSRVLGFTAQDQATMFLVLFVGAAIGGLLTAHPGSLDS